MWIRSRGRWASESPSTPAAPSPTSSRSTRRPARSRRSRRRRRPSDPSVGLLDGVEKVLAGARAAGRRTSTMLLHGSTVATNAVLEHKFDGLGLIVTRGFRHMIEIARQSVPDGYGNSFFWVKPQRLVPLHLVREVPGRLRFDGTRDRADRRGGDARRRCASWSRTASAASPSASSTPTPTARTSRRSARSDRQEFPGRLRLALLGGAARVPRVRAGDDHAHRRAGQALLQDLPRERRRQDPRDARATSRS